MDNRTEYRMEQVVCRAKKIQRQSEKYLLTVLSSASFLLAAGLVGAVGAAADHMKSGSVVMGTYGAVLLHSGGEAYVLTGIIAFVAGVMVTAICFRMRNNQRNREVAIRKYKDEIK